MVNAVKNWATNVLNLALCVTNFSLSKPQFSSDKMEGSIGTSLQGHPKCEFGSPCETWRVSHCNISAFENVAVYTVYIESRMSLALAEVSMKKKQWIICLFVLFIFLMFCRDSGDICQGCVKGGVYNQVQKTVVLYQFLRLFFFARCLAEQMEETPDELFLGEDSIGTW